MVGERANRRTLGTTPTNRSRLSNITNLVNSSSWSNENEHVKNTYHTNEFQLQQVNDGLPLGPTYRQRKLALSTSASIYKTMNKRYCLLERRELMRVNKVIREAEISSSVVCKRIKMLSTIEIWSDQPGKSSSVYFLPACQHGCVDATCDPRLLLTKRVKQTAEISFGAEISPKWIASLFHYVVGGDPVKCSESFGWKAW